MDIYCWDKTQKENMQYQRKKFEEYNDIKNAIISFNTHHKRPTALEIAKSLNFEKRDVNYHLYAMARNGLVYVHRESRHIPPTYTWYEFIVNGRLRPPLKRRTKSNGKYNRQRRDRSPRVNSPDDADVSSSGENNDVRERSFSDGMIE